MGEAKAKKNKNQPWAEGGYDDWGRYMQVKKAKLQEQFEEEAVGEVDFQNESSTSIFQGVAIFVNGYTNPPSDQLRRIMMAHGGTYHHYQRPQMTTHLIASNLPHCKIVAYKKAQNPLPLCKPEWITESVKSGRLLDYRDYLLYSQHTKTQPQLAAMFRKTTSDPKVLDKEGSCNNNTAAHCTKRPEFLSEFYNNSRLHHLSTMGATFKDYVNDLRAKSDGRFPGRERLRAMAKLEQAGPSTRPGASVSDSDDESLSHSSPGSSSSSSSSSSRSESVVMHIDMDCFFVSVGLLSQPELRGLPVAVTHATGRSTRSTEQHHSSMSEVASCSYEARAFGVRNGMFLGQALKLCPNLKTMSYDFEGYKRVSYALYDAVASYTLDIEAVSCDEMYVDCGKVLAETRCSSSSSSSSSLAFAELLRREIRDKTGCPASAGFGRNKLCARLATKKAKPDGQYHLHDQHVAEYIAPLLVRDLPSVGSSTAAKLKQQMGVTSCQELRAVSLSALQAEFGNKTGETLHNMCRGIDRSKLNLEHVRKSVSAEVNYGIRFEGPADASQFLAQLCAEVCHRLNKANARGRCLTLKLMVRAKEAPEEAAKYMGHGLCDHLTKSKHLVAPVDDLSIVSKEILTLWQHLNQSPKDIRGVGIQISRLEKHNGKNKASTSTLVDMFNKAASRDLDVRHQEISSSSSSSSKDCLSTKSSRDLGPTTKQTDYLREIKPSSSGRCSGKVQVPSSLNDIDMSVLAELPQDIRNDILDEYKWSKSTNRERASSQQRPPPSTNDDISYSQIDPDFLAALPDDVKQDVRMYCCTHSSKSNNSGGAWRSMLNKPSTSSNKRGRGAGKTRGLAANNRANKFATTKPSLLNLQPKNPAKQDDEREAPESKNERQREESDKDETVVEIDRRLAEDESKVAEHKDMVANLVRCLLRLAVKQVKAQIESWISESDSVSQVDLLSVGTFLGMLPERKRIQDLHTLMKTMHRCVIKTGSCVWHETYKKVARHIQRYMQLEYSSDLMLPPMRCDRCAR